MNHVRALFVFAVAVTGCRSLTHDHPSDEDHHAEAAHDELTAQGPKAPERPTKTLTRYQDGLELFMEYPALAVGQSSPLVAHFTDARSPAGFKAVKQGSVTASLRYEDGKEESFVANKLLRDGIFKPDVRPTRAGKANLTLALTGPQVAGTIDAGEVVVHPNLAGAVASAKPEAGGEQAFPYFKEQQWKTVYATAPVALQVLQGGVRASGELKAVAGQLAELSAPAPGRVPVGDAVPFLGQSVKKGQLLVRLLPTAGANAGDFAAIELEASRARAELGLAERELERSEEMLAKKAIPEKRVDEARVARELAVSRVEASARQRALFRSTQVGGGAVAGATFELRSPLDGVVAFADVTPGAVVQLGAKLLTVVNSDKLWLEAKVYEPEAPLVERSPGASFTVAGIDHEFVIDKNGGRLVAVGAVVDRVTRTVPIVFELQNPEGALKPGMFAKVVIFTGATLRVLAIPESAVVDDNGKSAVFVMDGGETFFKRVVKLGIHSGGYVQVQGGLAEGDRVVSRGAYEIKLATASGVIPAHGHQH